jgi:hypothetical protein
VVNLLWKGLWTRRLKDGLRDDHDDDDDVDNDDDDDNNGNDQ